MSINFCKDYTFIMLSKSASGCTSCISYAQMNSMYLGLNSSSGAGRYIETSCQGELQQHEKNNIVWVLHGTIKHCDLLERFCKDASDISPQLQREVLLILKLKKNYNNYKLFNDQLYSGCFCLSGCCQLVRLRWTLSVMHVGGNVSNHTSGLSSVSRQHAAQDICQQKRHIPYSHCHHILPFVFHRQHQAILEDTSRMAALWLIVAWRKMVNKGHGMARADWGRRGGKCLEKQYESPALMWCAHCLYLLLGFFHTATWHCLLYLFASLRYCVVVEAIFLVRLYCNRGQISMSPKAVFQMYWQIIQHWLMSSFIIMSTHIVVYFVSVSQKLPRSCENSVC